MQSDPAQEISMYKQFLTNRSLPSLLSDDGRAPIGDSRSDSKLTRILSPQLLTTPPTESLVATLICNDNSPSMYDSGAIRELESVLPKFISDLKRDPGIRASVLMAFAHFGDEFPLALAGPLGPVDELKPPKLTPSSGTPLCARIIASIKFLRAGRKLIRTQFNLVQKNSMLIEFTDGSAGDRELAEEARIAIQTTAMQNNIEVHLFGVGREADMEFLQYLAQHGRPAERLDGEKNFAELFAWLYQSLRVVSQAIPGREIEIRSVNGSWIKTQ
jgi:uncharacterized protein YegL